MLSSERHPCAAVVTHTCNRHCNRLLRNIERTQVSHVVAEGPLQLLPLPRGQSALLPPLQQLQRPRLVHAASPHRGVERRCAHALAACSGWGVGGVGAFDAQRVVRGLEGGG